VGKNISTIIELKTAQPRKHHAMKTYEGVEVQLHAILTSSLDKGEWSASRPSRFIPGKMGGWVHPRAGPEVVVKLMEACSLRKHESLLKISWIHLITPSRNFVEVR